MKNQECGAVKECTKCLEIKSINLFGINKPSKDGYFTQCKECRKKIRSALKETNHSLYLKQLNDAKKVKERLGKDHLKVSKSNWNTQNSEHVKSYRKTYYEQNYEHCLIAGKKHWQSVKRASVKWADRKAISNFYKEAKRLTKETGIQFHVDHIIPLNGLNVSGLHVEYNLQIITALDNNKKFRSFSEDICWPYVKA